MKYGLYVKVSGEWQKLSGFEATDSADAFGKGMSQLPPEHYDKPVALRPLYDGPAHLIEKPPAE